MKIEVRHTEPLEDYPRSDLTGTVRGTDGYEAHIAIHSPAKFRVKGNAARLELWIPGGAQLVRDVIHIKSAMLGEEQTVKIVF